MAQKTKKKTWESAEKKWGAIAGKSGYCVIPNILARYSGRLRINTAQQAVLYNLLSYWYDAENPPVVSKAKIAEGVGLSERQVQRHLHALKDKGLIEIQFPPRPGRNPNQYSFFGLTKKVEKLALAAQRGGRQAEYQRSKAILSATKDDNF